MQPSNQAVPHFTIETFVVDDNRSLGKGVRDKDGFFQNIPVAVLNQTTRNATAYDTENFISQIKGPSAFSMRLQEGVLAGEHGHPFVDLSTELGMQRLLHIEPKNQSSHIRSVSVKKVEDLGLDMIFMDAKGAGPYGQYFDEAMEDPSRNLAFSLRGISKARQDRKTGVVHKKLINLVTFDSNVVGSGFKYSTKRYMEAKEDLSFGSYEEVNVPISDQNIKMVHSVAMETFTDTELSDLFKSNKVLIGTRVTGYVNQAANTVVDPETQQQRSVFHSFLNVKR